MNVADKLKDKLTKHKKGSKQADVNTTNGSPTQTSTEQPARRRSSRFLRKRPVVMETMEVLQDRLGKANAALSEQFRVAESSAAYSEKRKDLLATEASNPEWSWAYFARSRASQIELKANEILIKIRESERVDPTLFGNLPSEKVPDSSTHDMGGRFLVNKPSIERSKIFKIASELPKGAHLHLHMNAELPPEKLMPHARKPEMDNNMFIRSTKALLESDDFKKTEIVFDVLPNDTNRADIFSRDYNPAFSKDGPNACWMRWVDFRRRFPENEVQLENTIEHSEDLVCKAEYWACEKMIVTLEHAYSDRQTLNGAWACFNQGTRAFKGLINYESVYRWYVGAIIDSMIRDKVMYAELRPMLMDKSIPSNDARRRLTHKDQMTIVCEEWQKKKQELINKNELRRFPFGVKIIYCTPRSIPRQKMKSELQDCLDLKLQFPDLICGFDLVGAEDRPNHIGFYADLLVGFTEACKQLNVSIPFMFHAGESLLDTGGSHNPENSNLYDSLLLNATRVGHGYSILKHPLLVEKFKKQNICLELCPTSNELLHLCGNIRQHIFPELLAAGLHCTLNADNPSLYRGTGQDSRSLSFEFCQVLMGDTRMSIHGWKQLAEWSIEHACLDIKQKAEAQSIFRKDWDAFCQWVVDNYAQHADNLEDLVHKKPV